MHSRRCLCFSASRGHDKTLAASSAIRLPAALKGDTAFSTGPGWTPLKQLRAVTPYQSPVSWQRPPRRPQTRRWRPPAAAAPSEAPTDRDAPSAAVAPASPIPQGPAQSCASTGILKDQLHFVASACFPRWPHLTTEAPVVRCFSDIGRHARGAGEVHKPLTQLRML